MSAPRVLRPHTGTMGCGKSKAAQAPGVETLAGTVLEQQSAEVKPSEETPAGTVVPAEAKPAEDKPAGTAVEEQQPAEAKPAEEKAAGTAVEEQQPAEAKPSEEKPAGTVLAEQPAEAKAEEVKPSGEKLEAVSEPVAVEVAGVQIESKGVWCTC